MKPGREREPPEIRFQILSRRPVLVVADDEIAHDLASATDFSSPASVGWVREREIDQFKTTNQRSPHLLVVALTLRA